MKKSVLLLLLFLLCACGDTGAFRNEDAVLYCDKAKEDSAVFVEQQYEEGDYEIGNGIRAIQLEDVEGSEIFPVYQGGKLLFLLIEPSGIIWDGSSLMEWFDSNEPFTAVESDGDILLVSEDEVLILGSGDSPVYSKQEEKMIRKIQKQKPEPNGFGKNREKLSIVWPKEESDGREYAKDRIVIKFTEGDLETKIRDYEEFCEGKVRYKFSNNVCVFDLGDITEKRLNWLLSASKDLDYVLDASLDGKNDQQGLNSPSATE